MVHYIRVSIRQVNVANAIGTMRCTDGLRILKMDETVALPIHPRDHPAYRYFDPLISMRVRADHAFPRTVHRCIQYRARVYSQGTDIYIV